MEGLRMLRRQQHLTQAELAQKMGVTQSLVAMWERNASMPSASKLPKLASILRCTIDQLYGREPPDGGEDSA